MESFIFGTSTLGLPIVAHRFGREGAKVLILGGVHGDEWEGVHAALGLVREWFSAFSYALQVTVVPMFNVEGVLAKTRANSRGVDLNRNLPTKDWTADVANPRYNPGPGANSEPENRALVGWLERERPSFVLSLHSWKPVLNVNGDCGLQARAIADLTGYSIAESIGYPTPGCLGTYCGLENGMPTLTYEIERGLETAKILEIHVPAILQALHVMDK